MSVVLVTGGTGKVGRRLVASLRAGGIAHRVAARATGFAWNDAGTWSAALDDVSSVYLIAPTQAGDPSPAMIAFAQTAIALGVRRVVLQSASLLDADGPAMGQVHRWLRHNAPQWAVLRPSWFMQNFSEGPHLATIRGENAIYSATGDGRVPFIDARDIARCALAALTKADGPNADFVLTGPHTLSYDDVARSIGAAAGRHVVHRRVDAQDLAARHMAAGLSPLTAQILAGMDAAIAGGAEDRVTGAVVALTGDPPGDFDAFAHAAASAWRD
ncbi:MAG: hypothetical protein WDM91_09675 [Rhizomicrobium sp.]